MTIERLRASLADRYTLNRELGAGGMATVYLAQDLKHDRMVAIKVLRPELGAVIGADRFLKEIKTTANLQHPHILGLIDSGDAGGLLWYAMPFVEGESLRDRLTREKQLPINDAVRVATEVAAALDYAHRHGVIHRDIKPENILLHDGSALVADFGIALAASTAGTRMTETGMSLGTPHYMSPEQAMGEREITARSDVYALGCVLYEMLVGDPPFTGSTAQAIVAKVVTEHPRSLVAQRHTIPPYVDAAVLTALEKLPADRFATAAEFAAALVNPSYTTASATGARAMVAAPARGWWVAAVVGVIALVLGMAGARALWPTRAAPRPPARLMLDFPASQQPRLNSSGLPMLAQLPDGSGLLYSGPGANTRTQLWIRRWSRLDATRLTQTVDDACCAVFSPGGDSMAYLSFPHTLQVIPVSGSLSTVVADSELTSVSDFGGGVDWGSDGMLYASGLAGLLRVPPRGGKVELVAPLDTVRGDLRFVWPAVLPGAHGVLVSVVPKKDPANYERVAIGVADPKTGKVQILLQGVRALYAPTGHLIVVKSNGVLWAVPFDAKSCRITGPEHELADTVAISAQSMGDLSLSPAGTLAYTKGVIQSFQVVWVNRSGQATPVAADLTDLGLDSPRLSPDGKQLIISMAGVDGRLNLWLKPLDGGAKRQLTFDGIANDRGGWRPGTNRFSYTSDRGSDGGNHTFELDVGGMGTVEKTDVHDPRSVWDVTWSPDGKWLVFRTDDQAAGNGDILGLRLGDTVATPLVATPAEELGQAISPDGHWIAYSSNATGRREIWVRPFPETGGGRYQVSTKGGTSPAWNSNGRELFYLDGEGNMVSVPVVPGPTFQPGQQSVLFSAVPFATNPFGRQYDVAPGGDRFVMIKGESDANVHVVVVFNFLEELKRAMAKL